MVDLLKFLAGGLILFWIFRKKKDPVISPEQEREEIEGRLVDDFMKEDSQEFFPGDKIDSNILPAGLSVIEDLSTTEPVISMTDYAVDQAENFKINSDIAKELDQADSITLILTNESLIGSTTEIFKSDQDMDETDPVGHSVFGLLDFREDPEIGWPHIFLNAAPDLTGSKRLIFMTYWDSDSGFDSTGNFLFSLGASATDHLKVALMDNYLFISPSDAAANVISIDITNLEKRLLIIEIEKKLNAGKGEITSVKFNNVLQTLANPGAYSPASGGGDRIGSLDGSSAFMQLGVIWNVFIHDLSGSPVAIHYWKGVPHGASEASWVDQVGSIDGFDHGSPGERDIYIGHIKTPSAPGGVSYQQANRDFSVNPIKVFFLKVIAENTTQLFELIEIKNKSIGGREFNQLIQVQNFISAQNSLATTVDIPLPEFLYLNNESYLNYILGPNQVVSIIFYYKQEDLITKIAPVDQFINASL